MAMAYNQIPNLERTEYIPNKKQDIYPTKNYTNFTQIPKGMKEKLNLPIKNSSYLKNMISKKTQQANQQGIKFNSKSNYGSNIFPLYNTNPNNFRRSYSNSNNNNSNNNSKNNLRNEAYLENNNDNNDNNDNNKLYSDNNFYGSDNANKNIIKNNNYDDNFKNSYKNNFYASCGTKKGNSTKSLLGNSFNYNNVSSNKLSNKSRSKSNGKSSKQTNNPMLNLIRTYTGKSSSKENPATYRKYRAQTKSTDKLYQNSTKYPVHINPNESAVADYTYHSNELVNNVNPLKNEPYPVNDVNVNLSKYNDYDYYHNLSVQPPENFNSNKSLNINNNTYSYNNLHNKNTNGYSIRENSNNPKMKKSFDVLSDILDSHFTVNSPNHPKINLSKAENNCDMRNGDSKLNISAYHSNNLNNNNNNININNENDLNSPNFNYNNLDLNNYNDNFNKKVNSQILNMSGNKENISGHAFYKDKIYQQQNEDQNTKMTINLSYLGENPPERFLDALEHIMTILDPIFDRLSLTQKLEKFIENTDDHRRTIRLGSLVGIYIMLKKFQIEDEIKIMVLEKIVDLLHKYETQEELFLVACLEIAGKFKIKN